ncbi:MAG: hypothetical protein ACXVBB_23095, partial [Isosphaeraceae bacterium]
MLTIAMRQAMLWGSGLAIVMRLLLTFAVSRKPCCRRSDAVTLNWLLVFLPIGIGLKWFEASPILVFLASALAIVPLAGLMGDATEALAKFLGPTVGGLLNASLWNAPEIIISGFALHAGLVNMVKSSLTGSIIGNLLFGLGVAFFAGGIKHRRNQRFDTHAARQTTALLT